MTHSTPSTPSSSSSSSSIPSTKNFGSSKKTRKGSFGQSSPSKIAEVGDFQGGYFIMPTPQPSTSPSSSYPSKPTRSSPDKRNKRYEPAQRDGILSAKDLSMYETTTPLSSSPNKNEYSPSKKNSRKPISAAKATSAAVPTPSASKDIISHDRWAGAAFSNAPPPSSLPLPSFPPLSSSPSSAPSSPPHHVSHSHPSNVPSHPHPLYLDVQTVHTHYTDPAAGYAMIHGGSNASYPSSNMNMEHLPAPYYAHPHPHHHHPSNMPVPHVHHHHHVHPMMSSSFPPSSSTLPLPPPATAATLPLALSLAELSIDLRRILNITEEVHPRLVPVHSS